MTITREQLDSGQFTYTDPDINLAEPRLPPVHPGEVLRDEFMGPLAISSYRLAADIHVPTSRILDMTKGKRAMTADTALRLSRHFGTSAAFWMQLQTSYDLRIAMRDHGEQIARDVVHRA